MKKIKTLVWILLVSLTVAAFCGCDSSSDEPSESGDIYGILNEMVSENYSLLTARIVTEYKGRSLESSYSIAKLSSAERIDYNLQSFSLFEEVNGEFVIPDSYQASSVGYAVISGGEVIESGGDSVDISEIGIPEFSFSAECFDGAEVSEGCFAASVKNPSGFLKKSVDCRDMFITVRFGDSISAIELSYISGDGASVGIRYSFSK